MLHYLLGYEYVYLLPLLLSAIFCLRMLRQKWPKQYRTLALLLITSFITEFFAIAWKWYLFEMFHPAYQKNNFWIYNVYVTIRLGILLVLFYQLIEATRVRKMILYGGPLLLVFGLINYSIIQGPHQYNTYSVIFAHVPIIILCLCYFGQLLGTDKMIALHKEPMVWLILGTFIYHSASLPFLIMLNFLNMQNSNLSILYLPINDTLNLIMCSFYLISSICNPQPTLPH